MFIVENKAITVHNSDTLSNTVDLPIIIREGKSNKNKTLMVSSRNVSSLMLSIPRRIK